MRKLRLTEAGYAFPLQFWPQAYESGLRITEIPVRLIYVDAGTPEALENGEARLLMG